MLLLDTDDFPPGDRVDAYRAFATAATGACGIEHELDADGRFHKRLNAWSFGPVTLFRTHGSGMRYWQTPQHLRRGPWNTFEVMTQTLGTGGFVCNGDQRRVTSRDLVLAGKSAGPWEINWSGTGESVALMMDADKLGLPDSMIRTAVTLAPYNDVAFLLFSHLTAINADADRLADEPGSAAVGDSVLALVRALIASAAGGSAKREVADQTRLPRILAYIRAHAAEPDLTLARVAAAHNLTPAALHRLCEDEGIDVNNWINRQRRKATRLN
ncbi:helix-turn-helix transcriptional regulator [Microbispora bryophytorum]|uniref:Helix-turn-helix transcriptional regulator n=1 Tax=Microbispora bryophytorum subsp. camponoti TaxID=1677852 RepID=A0ABR8L140_9ACTN|nr:helix-turn-helix transcriptional regulator [Microbispora camponoti]MBD3142168.1 helix-turn-helix transcriptional regulator [Microbispora camponoti]